MAKNIKKIREAIMANRGGHEEATDSQIMTVWDSLPPAAQKQYLESVKDKDKKEKADAVGNKT